MNGVPPIIGKSSVFHNLATALYTHYNDYYACYNISELTKNSAKIIVKVRHSLRLKILIILTFLYSFDNNTCEYQCYNAVFLRSVVRAWISPEMTSF